MKAYEIIEKAKAQSAELEEGEALYYSLDNEDIILGLDGCQPSNTFCLCTESEKDQPWGEALESLEEWLYQYS